MFPGQTFSAPFFIQYGPGNTQTVDGGDKYLYAVSTDGYAYNGNYLHLARVPLDKVQTARRGSTTTAGSAATVRVDEFAGRRDPRAAGRARAQPAGDPVRAERCKQVRADDVLLRRRRTATSRRRSENPYTRSGVLHLAQAVGTVDEACTTTARSAACGARVPCQLIPATRLDAADVGTPDDWLGLYDPALVQKFVYTQALSQQMLFVNGDWMNKYQYSGENLYALHGIPFDLSALPAP